MMRRMSTQIFIAFEALESTLISGELKRWKKEEERRRQHLRPENTIFQNPVISELDGILTRSKRLYVHLIKILLMNVV